MALLPSMFYAVNADAQTSARRPTGSSGDVSTLAKVIGDTCYQRLWNPLESDMGRGKWSAQRKAGSTTDPIFDQRASFERDAPGGVPAVRFTAYGDKDNALIDFRRSNAAPYMPRNGMEEARFMVSYYLPSNYEFFASGRLAAGMYITDPNNPGTCMGGGCLPSLQTGSSVRINFDRDERINGIRPMIYSYHLDRTSPVVSWKSPMGNGAPIIRQFGQGPTVPYAMPKNKWFTMILDIKLNDVGKANGKTRILVYNNDGKLMTHTQLTDVVYRTNPKWKIMGPYLTEKYNNGLGPGPKTQSMFARNFGIFKKLDNCH